jgi:hypothetical protein
LATQLLKITLEYIERIIEARRNVEKAFLDDKNLNSSKEHKSSWMTWQFIKLKKINK